ncbi:MAG: hypothetical protein DMF61_22405 [Blastocatellia bacterium AA13]|nr:MAG: hypothetical protein DMF61_22405 [Blastocatellia bacterium AA13]
MPNRHICVRCVEKGRTQRGLPSASTIPGAAELSPFTPFVTLIQRGSYSTFWPSSHLSTSRKRRAPIAS